MDDETAVRRSILDLRRLLHCMEHGDDRGLASPSILLRAQLAQDMLRNIQDHYLDDGTDEGGASVLLGELQPRVDQACRTARDVARIKKEHEIDYVEQIFFPRKEAPPPSEPALLTRTEPEEQIRAAEADQHSFSDKRQQQQQHLPPTQPEQSVQEIQADQRAQLEEEISHMAAQLKASTVRMNQSLKSQTQELDEMGLLAEQNVQEVGQAASNVNEHLKSSWGSTIATWTMIATVVGTFFFAMITMRMIPKRANVCLPFFCQNPSPHSQRAKQVDDEPWEAPCLFYCTQIPEYFGRATEQACQSLSNIMAHQFLCPEINKQHSVQDPLRTLDMERSSTNSPKHGNEMGQRREEAANTHTERLPHMDDTLSRVVKRRDELQKRREAATRVRELADMELTAMDDAPQQDVCLGESCAASSLYVTKSETKTLSLDAEAISSAVSAVADPVPLPVNPAVESSVNTLADIDHAITEAVSSAHVVHSETFSSDEGGPPQIEEIQQVHVPETQPVLGFNRQEASVAALSCNVDQVREFVTAHPSLVMEPDENGWTLFTECVASGCTEGALFIIDAIPGLDVNTRTSSGATSLWWAQTRRLPSDHSIFSAIGSLGGIIAGPGVERSVEHVEPIEEISPPIQEIVAPIVERIEESTTPVEDVAISPTIEEIAPPIEERIEDITPPIEDVEIISPPIEEIVPPIEERIEEITPPIEDVEIISPPIEEIVPPIEERIEEIIPPIEDVEISPPIEEEEITPPIEEIVPPIEEGIEEMTSPIEEEEEAVNHLDFDDSNVRAEAFHGNVRLLATLLDRAPQFLDAADENGWRPIHEAVRNDQFAAVNLLIARGADLNARTGREMDEASPLDMAIEYWGVDSELYQLLERHGAQ